MSLGLLALAFAIALAGPPPEGPGSDQWGAATMLQAARVHESQAQYRKAAELYGEYGTRFPRNLDAAGALERASVLWWGLDEPDRAHELAELHERQYRREDPQRAAAMMMDDLHRVEDEGERVARAKAYVKRYGPRAGIDRNAVATAIIAEAAWRRSCPKSAPDGSCISIQPGRKRRGQTRCLDQPAESVLVQRRRKRATETASEGFRWVLELSSKKLDIPREDRPRRLRYSNAIGMAMFITLESDFEAYLRLTPPLLDPNPETAAKQLAAYLVEKERRARELTHRYGQIETAMSPYWLLAATWRSGQLWELAARQLSSIERPTDPAVATVICDHVRGARLAVMRIAKEAYAHCLRRSTEFQWFTEHSRICEQRLEEIEPRDFPATHELLGTSNYTRTKMDSIPVITDWDQVLRIDARARGETREAPPLASQRPLEASDRIDGQ